ncbi:hypothetical protein C8J57DRAFT_1503410 [Mycena rebaudengoi]|nr:hypothetical protein C8J57DRAFT_1503410 [Mycena rebaudengoi]
MTLARARHRRPMRDHRHSVLWSSLRACETTNARSCDERKRAVRRISRMQWIWARKNDVHGESVLDYWTVPLYTRSPSCLRAIVVAPHQRRSCPACTLTISRHPTPTPKARQSGLGAGGASVDSAIAEREKR